jgi:hypothetical protein
VPGSGWQKVVVPFATVAGGISTRIGLISHNSTDNAIAYFDDIHLQPVSSYYYFSDQALPDGIVDLTANDPVLGVLRNRDISIVESVNIRQHIASIGGFSIKLIDEGLSDKFNTNKIYNRAIWVYLGTDDLSYLDDSLLLYKGVIKDQSVQGNEITLQIENSTGTVQKMLPQTELADTDGVQAVPFLPQQSKGKFKPIIYGDYRTNIDNVTAANTNLGTERHLCPAVYLGREDNGDHRWLISHHQVDAVDELWMYWDLLGRFVKVKTFATEQNTSSGCIISHTDLVNVYDFFHGDGQESTGTGGGGSVTNPNNYVERDVSTFTRLQCDDIDGGPAESATAQWRFPTHEVTDDDMVVEVVGYVLAAFDEGADVGNSTFQINHTPDTPDAKGASGSATFDTYTFTATTVISVNTVMEAQLVGATDPGLGDTNIADIYFGFKRIELTPDKLLPVYFGGRGREASTAVAGYFTGLSAGDVLENPVHIAGSIIQDELGLTPDLTRFDNLDGDFSSWKMQLYLTGLNGRENSKAVLDKLALQSKSFIWWDTNNQPSFDHFESAYTTDREIKLDEIADIKQLKIRKTKLSDIVNTFKLQYEHDEIDGIFRASVSREDDRATTGSQDIHNSEIQKDLEADYIVDATTAGLLADHWCKDDADSFWSTLHDVIEFPVVTNRGINIYDSGVFKPLIRLTLLDIIEFDDAQFDSVVKLNGQSWSGVQFKIFHIVRNKLGMKIKAFAV